MIRWVAAGVMLLVSGASFSQSSVVLDPGFKLDGRSASRLSASWWQWAYAAPEQTNPVRDRTGVQCATGQQGNIWFLAGGFGSSKIQRRCEIPFGKSIFFPVVNMVYFPDAPNNGLTCADAIRLAAYNNDAAVELFAEVDGVPVENVDRYRASTKVCFNVLGRVGKEHEPYNAFPSASDGFWIGLKPLAKGLHRLKFGGRYNQTSSAYGKMVQDIEYEIIVK